LSYFGIPKLDPAAVWIDVGFLQSCKAFIDWI